jgi:hypothetical protein
MLSMIATRAGKKRPHVRTKRVKKFVYLFFVVFCHPLTRSRKDFTLPTMSLLAILGWLLLSCLVLVFVEVACAMGQATWKPSVVLMVVATFLYNCALGLGRLLAHLSDVFSFFRRIVFWIRDVFFRFVPIDVILTALHDLQKPIHILVRVPLAFGRGVLEGLMEATVPIIASGTFLVGTLFFLVLWESLAIMFDHKVWRLSVLIAGLISALRDAASALGFYAVTFVVDIGTFVVDWLSRIFYIPLPIAKRALSSLYDSTANVTYVPTDFARGVKEGFALFQDSTMWWIVIRLIALLGMLAIAVFIIYHINWPTTKRSHRRHRLASAALPYGRSRVPSHSYRSHTC